MAYASFVDVVCAKPETRMGGRFLMELAIMIQYTRGKANNGKNVTDTLILGRMALAVACFLSRMTSFLISNAFVFQWILMVERVEG